MVRVALPATFKIRTDFRGEKIHDSFGQLSREVGHREAVGVSQRNGIFQARVRVRCAIMKHGN